MSFAFAGGLVTALPPPSSGGTVLKGLTGKGHLNRNIVSLWGQPLVNERTPGQPAQRISHPVADET
jgi:hypothetical protein